MIHSSPRNFQSRQGANQPNNPLKQLFSYPTSPKTKFHQVNRQKLSSGTVEIGNKYTYSVEDLIGDGYTSKVYKGHEIQKSTKTFAIKVIDKKRLDQDQIKLIKNQIDLHPSLNHNNIVQCYDVFDTNNLIYVVMEWCNSGDLAQYIHDFKDKQIPQWRAIEMMEQIVQGCKYLVQQGILHRDLKPANILRSGNTLKIADFGFAVKGKKTLIDSMSVGTPLYMPPESIQECVYSHKSDFFAIGCIMYELLHGRTPWYKNDEKALAKSMKSSQIDLSKIRNQNIRQFIEKACEISQGSRMSVEEFMSFDFRKPQVSLQFNLISFSNATQSLKPKVLQRQHTDRLVFNKTNRDELIAKSTKSKKSETVMQATFVSNHIYFKGAKSEQVKKITAEFQQKFEFCLLLKYLIQNSNDSILADQFDKKNLKIVLFRHSIFILKRLLNDFVRTKSFDPQSWSDYKETRQFKRFEEECKVMKEKMEKDFNLQLKGMSLKNLAEINKKFPQLVSQYELSKSFYEKMKQFLKEIICHFNQQLVKKFTKPSTLQKQSAPCIISQHYEAFKSMYRYYEHCEQKQQEEDINKSLGCRTNISSMKQSTTVTPTQSSNTSTLLSSAAKIPYQIKTKDEAILGKKQFFNHLSPEVEKHSLLSTSPKSKYIINKTAQKKISTQKNTEFDVEQQKNIRHVHFYAYTMKPNVSSFDTDLRNNVENMVYVQNSKKKINLQVPQKQQTKIQTKQKQYFKNSDIDTVQSHFAKSLCKNFEQSTMTKQEYLAIKKKLKWLW